MHICFYYLEVKLPKYYRTQPAKSKPSKELLALFDLFMNKLLVKSLFFSPISNKLDIMQKTWTNAVAMESGFSSKNRNCRSRNTSACGLQCSRSQSTA